MSHELPFTQFYFRVGSNLPQELLLPEHKEADQDVDIKATEYIEPAPKKGRGRSEEADSELKQLTKRAEPPRSLTVKPMKFNKLIEFPNNP